MSLYSKLSEFIKKYTDKIPGYKDGFFEIPFAGNSPESMVETLGKTFGHTNDRTKQVINSKTPFADGIFHYFKLADDCWLMVIDVHIKRNMRYKKMQFKQIDSNFYTFSYSRFTHQMPRIPKFDNNMLYSNNYFIVTSPGSTIEACYRKGTHALFINLMVTAEWLKTHTQQHKIKKNAVLDEFVKKGRPYLSWSERMPEVNTFHDNIRNAVQKKKLNDKNYVEKLTNLVYDMLDQMQISVNDQDPFLLYSDLNGDDRKKIVLAEQLLMKNLYDSFPGIEYIASQVGISSTKLKTCFKQIYGKTIFDYYRHHKMETAMVMLKTGKFLVKEVSRRIGYESASKFIAAFKNEFGILPSELNK